MGSGHVAFYVQGYDVIELVVQFVHGKPNEPNSILRRAHAIITCFGHFALFVASLVAIAVSDGNMPVYDYMREAEIRRALWGH